MDQLRVVVIQPTSLCNLNCRYCYISEDLRKNSLVMTEEVLEASIRALFASNDLRPTLLINWHAGEPLTAGIPFYEKACALIERLRPSNLNVIQSIQTNGVLINDKWCEFFKKSGIGVSVSIDGPEHIHNAKRRTWNDKDSFPKVMRGIEKLKSHGISFYALMVVTEAALDYPDDVFNFFLDQEIPEFGFNVEEVASSNDVSSMNRLREIERKYRAFLERLSELWIQKHPQLKIREFENRSKDILHSIQNRGEKFQIESSKGILTIKRNGDIVPFSPEMASGTAEDPDCFVVSNVLKLKSISEAFETQHFQTMYDEVQRGVDQCRKECEYFSMCGGGCPGNKLYEHQSFETTETQFCRHYYQNIIDVLLKHFEAVTPSP